MHPDDIPRIACGSYIPRFRKLDHPRPLSPYEALTGERFADHRDRFDRELDRLLADELREQTHEMIRLGVISPNSKHRG